MLPPLLNAVLPKPALCDVTEGGLFQISKEKKKKKAPYQVCVPPSETASFSIPSLSYGRFIEFHPEALNRGLNVLLSGLLLPSIFLLLIVHAGL